MPKLTIYGKQELPEPLNEDNEFSVAFLRMAVKKVEKDKSDNEITYKVENLGEIIIKQGDKVQKVLKENTAQKIRGAYYYIHNDLGLTEDFETFYNREKGKLIAYLPEIYQYLKNKL